MARSRNIKPSFFQNEQLGELEPIERIAFIGLWTISDFKGCVELRPKRLKIQLLPYDDCDFEKIVINLDKSGLIRNYSVQGKRYIKIINFEKHQNPHKNERDAGSEIPDISEADGIVPQPIENIGIEINLDKSGLIRNKDGTDPADSLFPLPDSLNLIPDCGTKIKAPKKQQKKFTSPSQEDIVNFQLENKLPDESINFFNYYESNGWMVGKNKMKNWQAAFRGWCNRSSKLTNGNNSAIGNQPTKRTTANENFDSKDYGQSTFDPPWESVVS